MAQILDGRAAAEVLKEEVRKQVELLSRIKGIVPGLAVIRSGDDTASEIYFARKEQACRQTGIKFFPFRLPIESGEEEIEELIKNLNHTREIHGIMLELPLPGHLNEKRLLSAIEPDKDVDGVNPLNLGKLMLGKPSLLPCTPQGVMAVLSHYGIEPEGKQAVVIGRSNIVGKPLAMLLLQAGATVTVCHSKTEGLESFTREADILCVAVGKPCFITGEMVKEGAVVIDIGINAVDGKIMGDVDFASVAGRAGAITPVPGGVGALTTVMVLRNTLEAAKAWASKS